MKWVFGGLVASGLLLWLVVATLSETLEHLGPRWSAALWAIGPTLAGVGVLLFAVSQPIRGQAKRLLRRAPNSITLVCQRTPDLRNGLARVPGVSLAHRSLPSYLVLRIGSEVEVWSASALWCSFDVSLVETVRLEPDSVIVIVIATRSEPGAPAPLAFKVCRDGWELWPERRPERLERVRREVAEACGLG